MLQSRSTLHGIAHRVYVSLYIGGIATTNTEPGGQAPRAYAMNVSMNATTLPIALIARATVTGAVAGVRPARRGRGRNDEKKSCSIPIFANN